MNKHSKTWPTAEVLAIPVDCLSKDTLVAELLQRIQQRETIHLVTMNAEMAYAAHSDPAHMQLLQAADIVIPDGIGVVWALGHQGIPVQRLPGIELTQALLDQAVGQHLRVGILGASPETLAALQTVLQARWPDLILPVLQDGYFSPEQEADIVQQIQAAELDILFVALGVPRQEEWIQRHQTALNVPLMMGVGGSFDVLSGRLERAPELMQRLHLEWLFRLLQQPSRWRRMLALPKFVVEVLRR